MFIDFEYDGKFLKDFGFIPCSFDSSYDESGLIHSVSKLTFNTVSGNNGKINSLTGTQYDECIEANFDICKNPCMYNEQEISESEYRELMRWLNRHRFLKFRAINDDNNYDACYYEASFNIEKRKVGDRLCALSLTLTTNKPFGTSPRVIMWEVTSNKKSKKIIDTSDEIGVIYPNVQITCLQDGDLKIENSTDEYITTIKGCKKNEIISIDGKIFNITSSLDSHTISNDFNFEFPKIINTYDNRINNFTISLPCKIRLEYNSIVKESI